jgi:hypothetical protein
MAVPFPITASHTYLNSNIEIRSHLYVYEIHRLHRRRKTAISI